MKREFVDLSLSDGTEVFVDVAEIQAIMEWETGSKVFIRGSDDPFRVRERPRKVFEGMGFKEV